MEFITENGIIDNISLNKDIITIEDYNVTIDTQFYNYIDSIPYNSGISKYYFYFNSVKYSLDGNGKPGISPTDIIALLNLINEMTFDGIASAITFGVNYAYQNNIYVVSSTAGNVNVSKPLSDILGLDETFILESNVKFYAPYRYNIVKSDTIYIVPNIFLNNYFIKNKTLSVLGYTHMRSNSTNILSTSMNIIMSGTTLMNLKKITINNSDMEIINTKMNLIINYQKITNRNEERLQREQAKFEREQQKLVEQNRNRINRMDLDKMSQALGPREFAKKNSVNPYKIKEMKGVPEEMITPEIIIKLSDAFKEINKDMTPKEVIKTIREDISIEDIEDDIDAIKEIFVPNIEIYNDFPQATDEQINKLTEISELAPSVYSNLVGGLVDGEKQPRGEREQQTVDQIEASLIQTSDYVDEIKRTKMDLDLVRERLNVEQETKTSKDNLNLYRQTLRQLNKLDPSSVSIDDISDAKYGNSERNKFIESRNNNIAYQRAVKNNFVNYQTIDIPKPYINKNQQYFSRDEIEATLPEGVEWDDIVLKEYNGKYRVGLAILKPDSNYILRQRYNNISNKPLDLSKTEPIITIEETVEEPMEV